jgi:hypothetical protein
VKLFTDTDKAVLERASDGMTYCRLHGWSKVAFCPSCPTTDSILDARAKTYGPFRDVSELTLTLVDAMNARREKDSLADDQSVALYMIQHKIARIITGDADHIDSWDDIAGYAKLVADRLRGIIR